jgi:serine/threonine protein kinase
MEVGELIGNRYTLLRSIGAGPLTLVYLAQDAAMDREVTVKVLRPEFAAQQEVAHRFQQEAQRIADLSHPNLAAVRAVGSEGATLYLVTEYLPAGSLRDRLDRDQPIAVDEAVDIAISIAAGLVACHTQGILHGDLKPQNVMFTEQRAVKVADGGMGRILASAHREGKARLREPAAFLTPEEVAGQPLTPASDIYALGVTLYEMLTGRPPFLAETASETALLHLHQDVPSIQKQNPRVPAPLTRIVRKMLNRDPQQRYASAQQVHQILLGYRRQRADLSRPARPAEAHTDHPHAAHSAEMAAQPATGSDLSLPSTQEGQEAEVGMDWPFVLLGLLAVLVILGLIILWTVVYRSYTLPLD